MRCDAVCVRMLADDTQSYSSTVEGSSRNDDGTQRKSRHLTALLASFSLSLSFLFLFLFLFSPSPPD